MNAALARRGPRGSLARTTREDHLGEKGARYSEDLGLFADELAESWQPIGNLTSKRMFGGVGIFVDGSMFALIDSDRRLHLKVGDLNAATLESVGGSLHGRMPYRSIPDEVLADGERLLALAMLSAAVVTSR